MASFKDRTGTIWEFDVTVATLRRVRDQVKHEGGGRFELLDLANVDSETFRAVMADPSRICDILFAVCLPLARERGVTDEAFGELLAGDSLQEATAALLEGIASFSPSPALRAALGKEFRALMTSTENVHRKLAGSIDETTLTAAIEAAYEAELRRQATSGGSPASAAQASSA